MTTLIIVISILAVSSLGWAVWLLGEEKKRRAELTQANNERRDLRTQLDTANDKIEDLQTQLTQANDKIEDLQTQLTQANDKIEDLQTQLTQANDKIEDLQTQLTQANDKIEDLQTQLTQANDKIEDLQTQLTQANDKIEDLQTQLTQANDKIEDLQTQLTQANDKIEDLQTQLTQANDKIEDLQTQLTQANDKIEDLQTQLTQANDKIEDLQTQLTQANRDKEDALWLLYLSEVSMQASASVLYSERRRSARLEETCEETIENYTEFHDKVEEQARNRLVRRGVGVVLSFIPGLGLFDILSDIGEILSDADDAFEDIEAVSTKFSGLATGFAIMRVVPPESAPGDEIPVDLIEDAQSTFNDSFEKTFKLDSGETLDASKLDTFVTETIQRTEDLESVRSMTEEQQEEIIVRTLGKVHDFAAASHNYHQTRKEAPEEKAADGKSS